MNIAEVMDLTAEKACIMLAGQPAAQKLEPLRKVGLGYLHLNQSLSTLSGGELQRIKLASFLNEKGKIFILDEPTDGLHMEDIRLLLQLFDRMTDSGNSLFLIEHNTDVLRQADHLIELGPGGGEAGGRILFAGTPEAMRSCPESVTKDYL
jgi:excinuclease UvrABC ATPase subunit